MAQKTGLTPYGEQTVEPFDKDGSVSGFKSYPSKSYRSRRSMSTNDGLPPHDPIPLFLSSPAEQSTQPGLGKAWDSAVISSRIVKTSILVVTAASIDLAILSVGNPSPGVSPATASLVGIFAA